MVIGNDVDVRFDWERQLKSSNLINIGTKRVLVIGAHVGIVCDIKEIGLCSTARARSSIRVGSVSGYAAAVWAHETVRAVVLRIVAVERVEIVAPTGRRRLHERTVGI